MLKNYVFLSRSRKPCLSEMPVLRGVLEDGKSANSSYTLSIRSDFGRILEALEVASRAPSP